MSDRQQELWLRKALAATPATPEQEMFCDEAQGYMEQFALAATAQTKTQDDQRMLESADSLRFLLHLRACPDCGKEYTLVHKMKQLRQENRLPTLPSLGSLRAPGVLRDLAGLIASWLPRIPSLKLSMRVLGRPEPAPPVGATGAGQHQVQVTIEDQTYTLELVIQAPDQALIVQGSLVPEERAWRGLTLHCYAVGESREAAQAELGRHSEFELTGLERASYVLTLQLPAGEEPLVLLDMRGTP